MLALSETSVATPNPTSRAVSERSPSMLVLELFRYFERENVNYVVVGDSENYFQEILGDIDIVVDHQSLSKIKDMLFRFCRQRGVRVVQALQHEQTAWYFVLAWTDEAGRLAFLHPDICADYLRLGRPFLSADEILAGRTRWFDREARSFFIPAPAQAYIYYLLKKIDKCDLNDQQGRYLSSQWKKDPIAAAMQLRRFWAESEAKLISQAAETNLWDQVRANLPKLQGVLRSALRFSAKHAYLELTRKIGRVLQPSGLLVAMLGADGAGKSAVLAQVEQDLAPAYRCTKRYHLRPQFGRSKADGPPVTAPHSKPARGWIASGAKLALWWADYTSGYCLDILPRLIHSTLVLYDRYYYDLTVDARRYRYGGSRRLAELLGKLIPRPQLVILLVAPAEVLQARKQEVPLEETTRQQAAYRELVDKIPCGRTVNAAKPLHEVVAAVNGLILDFMAERTARRLGPERSDHSGS